MIIQTIIAVLLAYLIGAIPTSVWIGRIFYGIDVRTLGSGNAGATNTLRVLGARAGIPVLIFDVFKGWFAVFISHFLSDDPAFLTDLTDLKIILSIAAVIGHVFPVYVGFKGGKGIATLLGIGFALYPLSALIAVGVFTITLLIIGYVSLGSILAAITFPVTEIVILEHTQHISLVVLAILVAIFVPLTHRKNIRRLITGSETKFSIKNSRKG
jgi:glycerol-3-phosphate acyltransferase PlsY